jgi:hypothetical protein
VLYGSLKDALWLGCRAPGTAISADTAYHNFKLLVHKVKMPKRISELNQELVDIVLFEGPAIISVHWKGYGLNEAQRELCLHRPKPGALCFDVRSVGRPDAGETPNAGSALSSGTLRLRNVLLAVLMRSQWTRWRSWLRHCAISRKVADSNGILQ